MAFHIRDPETDRIVRELAARKGATLTETVKDACAKALEATAPCPSKRAALEGIWRRLEKYPPTGLKADKAFFDELSGDE